jgi:hypothetical protein
MKPELSSNDKIQQEFISQIDKHHLDWTTTIKEIVDVWTSHPSHLKAEYWY